MKIELPIFRQIGRDTRLPPRAFQVWRAAIELLDVVEWRTLKQVEIEHSLSVDQSTVSRALTRLVAQGYLCRQRATGGGATAQYRVPLSQRECTERAPDARLAEDREAPEGTPQPARRSRARMVSRGVL